MDYDKDKVDEMVLALLYLTTTKDKFGTRAWKGMDWEALDRLHKKGYISNPREKSPTLVLSENGARLSQETFQKLFSVDQ